MNETIEQTQVKTGARHGMVALDSQGEARRNRLLRRVDWRFLAGVPHPKKALVQAGRGTLTQALGLVAEQVLALDEAGPESAGLAALINPSQADLECAWQALEPGGSLYLEEYLPIPGRVRALRRNLADLGFRVEGSYWPWPWPERAAPAFWLHLEAPGAIRYFLNNRPPARGLVGRGLRAGLQFAWRLGQRLELLAPLCMVAHKPAPSGSDKGLPATSLSARAQEWRLDPDGTGLDWLLLTGGLHSTNKVTGLVFPRGESTPRYVVKMPRREEVSLSSLEHEAEVLRVLQSRRVHPLPGVPQLISLKTQNDFPVLVETYLAGTPLYTVMQPERLPELAHQASRWLLNLVEPGPPQAPETWWDRLAAPVLDDFERGYAAVGGVPILAAARKELDRLGPLPLATEHRDFSPWNIFVTPSGALTVLDWEGAEPDGLPFSDLLYFLTYLTFFAEGALESGTTREAYRRMLDPQTQPGRLASTCIEEYCRATGLDKNVLRPLRLLTWMRHAGLERTLIANSSSGEPETRLLERGLYLALLQVELEMMA